MNLNKNPIIFVRCLIATISGRWLVEICATQFTRLEATIYESKLLLRYDMFMI